MPLHRVTVATQPVGRRFQTLRGWTAMRWTVVILVAAGSALALGIPTGVVRTPFYTRMTPVLWWNYPVLAASAMLIGLTAATYVRGPAGARQTEAHAATGGGLLSLFAIGCPICNKLVVLALGVSGALRYFAPLQPLLAVASLAVVGGALWARLGALSACPVTASGPM